MNFVIFIGEIIQKNDLLFFCELIEKIIFSQDYHKQLPSVNKNVLMFDLPLYTDNTIINYIQLIFYKILLLTFIFYVSYYICYKILKVRVFLHGFINTCYGIHNG